MSRGPGRIQQAVARAFDANPSAVFSAKEIIALAFPGVDCHEAKHRISALRTARLLAEHSNKFETYCGAPSAGGMIIVNATDRRSLGIGKVFEKFAGTKSVAECTAILDDPMSEAYPEAQVNGFFDLIARRNALWAEARDDEAEVLSVLIRERIAAAQRTRTTRTSQPDDGARS